MAQPTSGDVHVDAALTDMSIAYVQDEETAYIAGRVFPSKPVAHKTNKYHIFTKNDWFRDDAVVKRAPGQGAPRAGFTLSTGSYDCEPWWTAVPLSEIVRANSDPSVPLDEAATRLVTQRMLIRRDRQFVTDFMATSIWDTDKTPSPTWDDATSDPEKDVSDALAVVQKNTGFRPNLFILSREVFDVLKRHPLIKDRFKYTSAESITRDMLARFFEVDRVEIMESVYATNVESGTAAMSFIVGKHGLLVYESGLADIMQPAAVTNFVWSGLTGINDLGVRIDQFYDPDIKEDVVRGEFAYASVVTGTDLGYFFNGASA